MQDLTSGKTALHMAVEKGSLTDVQFMLETCRANINATTYTGCTPLHIASGRGDIALTAYLLSMGANPDLATDEGDTALDLAGSNQVCLHASDYSYMERSGSEGEWREGGRGRGRERENNLMI